MIMENYFVCIMKNGSWENFDHKCNKVDLLSGSAFAFKNVDGSGEVTLSIIPIDNILRIDNYIVEDNEQEGEE